MWGTRLRVHRKNPLMQYSRSDNNDDGAFLGVGDCAEVIDHPAVEPREELVPTKPDWDNRPEGVTPDRFPAVGAGERTTFKRETALCVF